MDRLRAPSYTDDQSHAAHHTTEQRTSKLFFETGNNTDGLLNYHKPGHRLARARVDGYHLPEFLDRLVYVLDAQSVGRRKTRLRHQWSPRLRHQWCPSLY